MSWQIPTEIEKDIKNGKAQYRTFQTGNGGQSILPVPSNSYVVIFGYDFSPAGGGFKFGQNLTSIVLSGTTIVDTNSVIRPFETQQISFYTGTDFYPFIHHVNIQSNILVGRIDASTLDDNKVTVNQLFEEINAEILARQVYITSTNDVTITHGLVNKSTRVSGNAIPVTNRTPLGLTYGGSAQVINTQTNYGPAGTPLQFMQPSPKDYQDFAFGLLPSNADGQAFATPDATNGLIDASSYLQTLNGIYGTEAINNAAANYYLCLHYALYTETVPEQRG